MDKHTEELAALYVLDLLKGSEKAAFEKKLTESPELQSLVREFGSGLHSPMRQAPGPRRPDLLEGIHDRIGVEKQNSGPAPVVAAPVPWRYIWGVAAVLLLLMNLTLVVLLSNQSSVGSNEVLYDTSPALQASLEDRISTLENELNSRTSAMQDIALAHKVALKENAEIKEDLNEWQVEYMEMASRVLPFFDSTDGMSRFTVIELVDARPSSDPDKRTYVDMAGYFLTGDEVTQLRNSSTGNASIKAGSQLVNDDGQEPMGFTIWREGDRTGFLDIYNLPPLDQGEDYFLWIRSSRSEPYTPVGHLPELSNGNGSLFYSVDNREIDRTGEILITAEADPQPEQPSGKSYLVGP